MRSIKWYVWINAIVVCIMALALLSGQRATAPVETPTALSMEPVRRDAGVPITPPTLPADAVPTSRWPDCSLPLYPVKVAASRRVVNDTRAEIVYETQWDQRLDDADHGTFVARAKTWTPECRMKAIQKACSPHCIYGDEYTAIIESAADLVEGKALFGAVLAINESELKHARAVLAETKRFATYAKTIVPHSTATIGGRACLERMRRDHERLMRMRQDADKPFTRNVVTTALVHATGCVTCIEGPSRERDCKWMHEEIVKGESRLREAEKEHADMRKLMTRGVR